MPQLRIGSKNYKIKSFPHITLLLRVDVVSPVINYLSFAVTVREVSALIEHHSVRNRRRYDPTVLIQTYTDVVQ